MATTQSEDPNERVNHPRWYTSHASGIECIDLIEHLPCNLANAVKYVWRCGLKQSETPLRDLRSALWYTQRELRRIDLYELDQDDLPKTEIVWRALAKQVIASDTESLLSAYLVDLLDDDLIGMVNVLNEAIDEQATR